MSGRSVKRERRRLRRELDARNLDPQSIRQSQIVATEMALSAALNTPPGWMPAWVYRWAVRTTLDLDASPLIKNRTEHHARNLEVAPRVRQKAANLVARIKSVVTGEPRGYIGRPRPLPPSVDTGAGAKVQAEVPEGTRGV